MKMRIFQKEVVFGVTALTLALAPLAMSQTSSTTYVSESASVIGACGKLFDVDANAAGLTASERAAIIQKNLDNAIVKAHNRTPDAVQVSVVNRNPVVTLDGFHIATADGNNAARNNMSQLALAQKWADTIKFCLADAAAMDKYLSMLTGAYKTVAVAPRQETIAYAPAGMFLPVKMVTPIDSETSQIGDRVEAIISTDIPLRTSQAATQFEAYLPAGSVAIGQLQDSSNSYLGKNALGMRFDHLRLPDGQVLPISGHILGGVGTWVHFTTSPQVAEYGTIAGTIPTPKAGLLASKGDICGGWRGYTIGAGLDIPFQKMVMKRRTGVAVPAGEPMMLQLSAPTAVALCTNCEAGTASIASNILPAPPIASGDLPAGRYPLMEVQSFSRVETRRAYTPAPRKIVRRAVRTETILK